MKKTILLFVALCLLVPVTLSAQNKSTGKKKTATQTTYPQRDSAFKADYRLSPLGAFNPESVLQLDYVMVPAPDFKGHLLKRNTSRKQVTLTQLSCKANQITDDDLWVERNDLSLREQRIETPIYQFGPRFSYRTGGYLVTTYGEHWGYTNKVVVTDESGQTLYAAFDFESFKYSPNTTLMGNTQTVNDVVIEGNILYVAHGSNSYSDGAGYQTGYISAYDMEHNEILWTTKPMTCNSHFAIVGNSIICGYGFTSEPDNLFVVDKYSGQRIKKIPMKKMVTEIVPKGDRLYVRTYSYDYVFRFQ